KGRPRGEDFASMFTLDRGITIAKVREYVCSRPNDYECRIGSAPITRGKRVADRHWGAQTVGESESQWDVDRGLCGLGKRSGPGSGTGSGFSTTAGWEVERARPAQTDFREDPGG